MSHASTASWALTLLPSGITSSLASALALIEHLPGAIILTIFVVVFGLIFLCTLAWLGHREQRRLRDGSTTTPASNTAAFCSLDDAFNLSGDLDRASFLRKLRTLCGRGEVTALGRKHGPATDYVAIPRADWIAYRLDFAEGGCAIPEGAGDEFLGALRAINLFEATGQMHRLKKDWVRPIGWYDLRFGDGRNHRYSA